MKNTKFPAWLRIGFMVVSILVVAATLSGGAGYFVGRAVFNRYFDVWGRRLVDLEKRGLLSAEYGAAWKDVLADEAMESQAQKLVENGSDGVGDTVRVVDGVRLSDYPSLSIIRKLNAVQEYSNTIEINDRKDRRIALIRTNHTRARIGEFPRVLLVALVAAEDGNFYRNPLGFEFDSYVRAMSRAVWRSMTRLRGTTPAGTSTITQQVAKLFISDLDDEGRRVVRRSIDRKVREMRISAALRRMYTADEILEVYLNHCVTSDYGLIGFKDISLGLFGRQPRQLSDAQCIYLARMVKWGRNVPEKISRQCRIDMPRMAQALGWDAARQASVIAQIDSLTFERPRQIETENGQLVDLANEYWLGTLRRVNGPGDYADMNLIDPNSLIRKKGNLRIRLTIDRDLQRLLERLVNNRGYGPDTLIQTDVRIGSRGEEVTCPRPPADTVRRITVLKQSQAFREENSSFVTTLDAGDTLVTNVRYRRVKGNQYHRSQFFYTRRKVKVNGQYFAYCILDSRSGRLLAYYSRDRIGSRLAGLVQNRVPNGSSTAKPIFNALNFDLGIFRPYDAFCDSVSVQRDVAWRRQVIKGRSDGGGEVIFANSAIPGKGYKIHNHGYIFEGGQYIFDHLATSNNILGMETVYRLNTRLFDMMGNPLPEAFRVNQLLYRIGAFSRVKDELRLQQVTGVRLYKELARIVGLGIDSVTSAGRRMPLSDSLYSVGLGTLELSLLEQAHIFNMLYNNDLIENPAVHPSLFIDTIELNGTGISMALADTVRRFHPFADCANLRPTYLGMHKRLCGQWDGLNDFDMPLTADAMPVPSPGSGFDPDVLLLDGPATNFAKSGTTDDVLRPFNVDAASRKRTNYGMWNAVIRIDYSRLSSSVVPEVADITIACIGEGNTHYTGARDGKTMHKFLSRDLLRLAGVGSANGFYRQYEAYLRAVTPDTVFANVCAPQTAQTDAQRRGLFGLFKKSREETTAEPSLPVPTEFIEEGDIE